MFRCLSVVFALISAPVLAQTPEYVGSKECIACHEDVAENWATSHHALAWNAPDQATVLADFGGTRFEHKGVVTEFRQDAQGYFAKTTEADGSKTDRKLHSVVGVEPLQQYLFETEKGRLQSADVVWDTEKEEWFHLYPDQDLPPEDGLHWTGPYKNWNARCAECHATNYKRNYGPRSKSYSSTQLETGVGCESCHGPGSSHIEWTLGKVPAENLDPFGFTMSFSGGNAETEIQQCAGCHSRREAQLDGNPIPGTPYADSYALALLRPGLYHADGQILDEVYVYGSFLQSKMYSKGVGCTNCHEPHGAGLKAEGNAVCTQCHSEAGNPDFSSLPLYDYDTPEHHRHSEGSEGAQCKSCHMIERTYMGIDGRRDHSFRVPRPDLGAETGGPDACTDCHQDQGQDWAADKIANWFPNPKNRQPHFGQVFARARLNPGIEAPKLRDIALDVNQAGIVRATALSMLEPSASEPLAATVAPLLSDPDPLLRAGAASLQRGAPLKTRVERLLPVLQDPMRSVRIAAAKQFLGADTGTLSRSQQAGIDEGMQDWQQSLRTRLDFPETHLVFGGMALTMRNAQAAEQAFSEVVDMDPQRAEAWPMLVRLAHINRGPDAARVVLERGLSVVPGHPELLRLQQELR